MIRTGSVGIDIALGGGWTEGTLNEIWGDPGAGKTVMALHTVESVVRARKEVLWVDTVGGVEHMTTAPRVVVLRLREAERAFEVMEMACHEPEIGLIVVDSANYLVRRAELRGDPDFVPHPQREYAAELKSLKMLAAATKTTVLFVSQPRDKEREPIRGTGISEKVFYRVHLHPDVVHQDGTREIAGIVKNVPGKVTSARKARFTVIPGEGIDRVRELIQVAEWMGIVVRRGAWFAWNNTQAQGIDEMARALTDDQCEDLYNEIMTTALTVPASRA